MTSHAASSLEAENQYLRARLEFFTARFSNWSGLSWADGLTNKSWEAIPAGTQWQLLSNGAARLYPPELARPPKRPLAANGSTGVDQVGGGEAVHRYLRFNGQRPMWSAKLLQAMLQAQMKGGEDGIAPNHYPFAASDIARAVEAFLPDSHARVAVAVFSSISPWVELTLLKVLGSRASTITTVDYNPPIVNADTLSARVGQRLPFEKLFLRQLGESYARGRLGFPLIVSFSGVEHDGLGRYGDPVHPDGDLAAMREMWLALREGGLLLLGVPTCSHDELVWPGHRIYGPARLPRLLEGFRLIGRVRKGHIVRGGLELADQPPTLWSPQYHNACDWSRHPVMVLQKPARGGGAEVGPS